MGFLSKDEQDLLDDASRLIEKAGTSRPDKAAPAWLKAAEYLDKQRAKMHDRRPEFADRYVELLLISDDGIVSKPMEPLQQSGNTKTFAFRLRKEKVDAPPGQLLLAVASSKPLQALKLPPDGLPAEQVFTRVLAEKLQTRQPVNVDWRYFRLVK